MEHFQWLIAVEFHEKHNLTLIETLYEVPLLGSECYFYAEFSLVFVLVQTLLC